MCYHSFNLLISRSPPLRVYCRQLSCTIRTRFPFASVQHTELRLATDNNSQTHYAKGKRSPPCGGSHTLYAIGFRFYFTPLAGVLFTFPSRYLFTIGCQRVFSLIQWSGRIHAEFHVHRITWDAPKGWFNFTHPAVTVSGRFFHIVAFFVPPPISRSLNPGRTSPPGLGCSAFARHY